MSASILYNDHGLVDSARSLPLVPDSHSSPHDIDFQSRHFVMPEFGPWSEVNTRLEHDAAPAHQPPGSAYVHDDSNRPVPRSSDPRKIASRESCLAMATIRCGQCRAEFTGTYRRGNLARHVRQKHTSRNMNTYTCMIAGCNKSFARSDARSKHAKKQHPDLCPEPVRRGHIRELTRTAGSHRKNSSSTYHRRSDASVLRDRTSLHQHSFGTRPGMEYNNADFDPTSSGSREMDIAPTVHDIGASSATESTLCGSAVADHVSYAGQWLPEASQTSGLDEARFHQAYFEQDQDCSFQLGLDQSTRTILCKMHVKLGTDNFMEFVDAYFTRWESIVQYMRDAKSAVYPYYSHSLHDIYAMVQNIIKVASIPIDTTAQQYRERQPHGTTYAGPYCDLGVQSNPDTGDSLDMSSRLDVQWPNFASGPDPTDRTTTNRTSKRPEDLKFNCPLFKWFRKHGGPRPCHGCQETTVAKVRHHCNRTSHHRRPRFAKQCGICKRDFVNAHAYQAHTSTQPPCSFRPQARGDITAWVRFYLAYFPDAVRVVSPYDGEDDYLPDDTVERCRLPPAATDLDTGAPSRSFLDPQRQHVSSVMAGAAAADFMVQDAMNLLNRGESAQPSQNASLYEDSTRTVAHFFEVLHRRPNLTHQQLRCLVDHTQAATRQLSGLLEMVEMAEAAISVYHTSEQRLQVEHRNRLPSDSTYQLFYPPQEYLHPADAGGTDGYQHSPTASSVHYDLTGMSTQPSSQGFDTASSAYVHSIETRPSSVQSPEDPILHSPSASPYAYEQTSASFGTSLYSPPQHLSPYQASVGEGYRQCVPEPDSNMAPSYIDPGLLQQPFGGTDLQN